MVPDELKFEPKSKGLATPRKKKPKELAVITECCTGCAGSPACVEYCPVEDCMFLGAGRRLYAVWPNRSRSHTLHRAARNQQGAGWMLPGRLPWDAIVMIDTAEVEKEVGVMEI